MSKSEAPEHVFTEIFEKNIWMGEARSGPGSALRTTEIIREKLAAMLRKLSIETLCDAPCGDGTWIFAMDYALKTYVGVDVVKEVVLKNRDANFAPNRFFVSGDISEMVLPKVDAIICRDCLVHMPLEMAQKTIANFQATGSKYLITTTFPIRTQNNQARIGSWRPLNLQVAPFGLPDPIYILAERASNPNDKYNDKSLGVWLLSDIH